MATKPSFIPAWCTTGTRAAPTPPEQASGWTSGDRPSAQQLNWLVGLLGDWSAYLSDGALAGNHTITGTLGVSGLTTLNGGGNVPTGQTLTVASGGTLDVNGVADLAGASALRLPSRVKHLDVSAGRVVIGTGNVAAGFTAGTTPTALLLPVDLHVGDQITGIKVYYSRVSGTSIGFTLVEINASTDGTADVVSKIVSSGTGLTSTDLQASPSSGSLPKTLLAGRTYRVRCDIGNGDIVTGVEVTYDRPA